MRTWEQASTLSERLRVTLDARRLTQAELARRSGLSTSYISALVNGQRGTRMGNQAATAIGRALRVPRDFFLTFEEGDRAR